ncbi:hypothetical protein LINPERHAP2_LOCUS37831 [Linum perenne]
MEPWTNPS